MRKLILAAVVAAMFPISAHAADLSNAARAMEVNRTAAMLRLSMKQLEQDKTNGAAEQVIAQDEASVRENQSAFKKAANLD